MVQISNLLKQSSDSNLIQGFVTSPVRCILTFSQIRHFKRIDLKLLFNSYAFHEYYCWAFENLINTLGGPMTDYLSVLVSVISHSMLLAIISLKWSRILSMMNTFDIHLLIHALWQSNLPATGGYFTPERVHGEKSIAYHLSKISKQNESKWTRTS